MVKFPVPIIPKGEKDPESFDKILSHAMNLYMAEEFLATKNRSFQVADFTSELSSLVKPTDIW